MAKDKCKTHGCNLFPYDQGYCIQCVLKGRIKGFKPKKETNKFNHLDFKSQVKLFEYVWKSRKHKCYVTGEDLNRYNGSNQFLNLFGHILRKSAFKEFKYYVNNIVLICPEVHAHFDNSPLDKILKYEEETGNSFKILFELEEKIYLEYVKEFGKKTAPRKIMQRYLELKRDIVT